jgi:hypothetical protein
MKKILLLALIFSSLRLFAQNMHRDDSIYYLIDTAKTPINERLWSIDINNMYKAYTLNCPCLKYNGSPYFYYSLKETSYPAQVINRTELKRLKLITLRELITKSRLFLDTSITSNAFCFIEPYGRDYIVHHVDLRNSAEKIVSPPDSYKIPSNTSAFKANGLITIDSKNIARYSNKNVITFGLIMETKAVDGDGGDVLLFVDDSYPNQNYTIVIKGINRSNFDAPELQYKNKQIKVTGIVTKYKGKPAIEIRKEDQIQIISSFRK